MKHFYINPAIDFVVGPKCYFYYYPDTGTVFPYNISGDSMLAFFDSTVIDYSEKF